MTGGEIFHGHGKHRPGTRSWTPAPDGAHRHAHAKAVLAPPGVTITDPRPVEPAEVVITTVPITGLSSFDIGTVPASVTPPPTWRHAAWFAVSASAAVLIALTFAAFALMGKPNQWRTIDALPGLPGATDLITTVPADGPATRATAPGHPVRPPGADTPDRVRTDSTLLPVPGGQPAPRDPSLPAITNTSDPGTGDPSTSDPTSDTPAPPLRSTETPYLMSTVDAQQIGDKTETYYDNVVSDPQAAYAMTTGPMQSEGPDGIKRRYQDVTGVQVEKITIDPATARTTNVVRLTHRDGSTTTQQRVLTFSPGNDPRISSESTG